ncbi:MAG: HAD-IA family hydrolase [Pseudomonadota bacterium]
MQFDTIFFDIGNTLFFFNYEFLQELLAQRFSISLPASEIEVKHEAVKRSIVDEGLVGRLTHDELWWEINRRWLVSLGIDDEMVKPIAEAVRNHPFSHLFWSRMDEGTPEMLDWFRGRGFKLGVISNAEGQIKRLIQHARLEDFFGAVIDSGEVGFSKPDRRIFSHAMDIMQAKPSGSVYVGDLFEVDVMGARAAGLTPILVDRDGRRQGKADCITVSRAVELPKLDIFADR